jgi:YD repeat-containing protein
LQGSRESWSQAGVPAGAAEHQARRLNQAGVANAFASNADGQLTSRPDTAGAAYQRLEWDHLGRLTRVKGPSGNSAIATYAYDPLDRLRVADHGGSSRIRFRYQGLTTSAVQTVDDQSGAVIRSIGTGWGGELLEDWTGTGSDLRVYGTNGHHDVTWTSGASGTVTGTVRYDCHEEGPR